MDKKNTYTKKKILDKRYKTYNKKLILMPRGSFKTSCVTIGLAIQEILKDPNIRILIDSETWDKSKDFLSEIKGHLENNQKFIEMFGRLKPESPDKWTASAITIATRTKNRKEPTISTAGIGVTKVGMHYDLIIMDDLHSQNNVTTPEMIEAVIEHYKLALSLLEPNGKLVVIGTRWDYSDLYSYILENEKDVFSFHVRRAIMDDGSLLFPSRLTKQFLSEQKKAMGSYLFSCQYMNEPVDDETAVFKQKNFKYFKMEDLEGKTLNTFITCDPAISTESYADYSVILVGAHDEYFNLYILDIFRERLLPDKLVDKMEEFYSKYMPKAIALETTAYQKTLKYTLEEHARETGHWMNIAETKRDSRVSKDMRIRSLQPKYENGLIHHLKGGNNVSELEYELLHFPRYKHDDIIDALADQFSIAFQPRKKRGWRRPKKYLQGKYVAI